MTCLYPDQSYIPESTNGYSAVMDIRYGSFAALMTGDLEADGESMLLQYDFSGLGFGLRREGYDVLKVAHHGSRFSSTQEFLEAVSPDLAVISAGRNNQYGHPHEETLERLQHTGARILITSECGEVILQAGLDGKIDVTTKNRLQTDE